MRQRMQLILLLTLVYPTNSGIYAQLKSMKLSAEVVDFGNIASVMVPAKTVEFTNVSEERLAILVVEKGPDVKVGYKHQFFEPGEKGLISLFYEAGKLGPFNEQIRIFTNLDVTPYILTLQGNSVTLEECFPDKANLNLRNVLVVNKQTHAPIPFAGVTFIHNFDKNRPMTCNTDKSGKAVKELPIGQYNAQSVTEGYETFNRDFFLPRSQPNILIELDPLKVLQVTAPVANPDVTLNFPDIVTTDKRPVTSTEMPEDKYAANNIVLLLDVSSSMRSGSKFTLLQQSCSRAVRKMVGDKVTGKG